MKRNSFKYMVNIKWSEEDAAYIAEVPELPGCATHGASYIAAMKNAEDAIASWIEGAKEAGYPIPEPLAVKTFSGKFMTRLSPELHRTLAVKAREMGKSLNSVIQTLLQSGLEAVEMH